MKFYILYSIIFFLSLYNLFIYNSYTFSQTVIADYKKDNDFLARQNSQLKIELSHLR